MKSKITLLTISLVFAACSPRQRSTENVVRIPIIADAKTFDPQMLEDHYSALVTSLVYEGLVEYEYLKRPHELKPALAESMPSVSKDGLTYTFKIKKGVKFIDHPAFADGKGRDVMAKDFVFSLMRLADPQLNSPSFWVVDGHIEGLNEWRTARSAFLEGKGPDTNYDTPVAGLRAVDDYTLEIKVKRKYPQLLFVLAMPQGFAVPREVVEKLGPEFGTNPVGTGPYILENWQRNSKVSFRRNPNFREDFYPTEGEKSDEAAGRLVDAGKRLPFADRVEYHVFVEDNVGWLKFMAGELDVSAIPKDNYKDAIDPKTQQLVESFVKKGVTLEKAIEPDVTYVAFNMEDPVIKKGGANLRKAMALAINSASTIEMFHNGRALLAHSPVPPGLAGYDETFVNPYQAFNLEKAKEYLAKAGFPEGKGLPELVYEGTTGATSRQRAEKMRDELSQIGIRVRINANEFKELTEKINKKTAQMWGIAWLADYPDAENFLQLLYGKNASPGPNGANFKNAQYDRLYEQMRGMADSPERRKIIRQMLDIFVQEVPWIVEAHRVRYTLMTPWMKNFKGGYMGSSPAKFYRIDTEAKAAGFRK